MSCSFILLFLLCVNYGDADVVSFQLREEAPPGELVGNLVKKLGVGAPPNELLNNVYQLNTKYLFISNMFQVDNKTSDIRTLVKIDRDSLCPDHHFCCSKSDICRLEFYINMQMQPTFNRMRIAVEIIDINDNAPIFSDKLWKIEIPESAQAGEYEISLPAAKDADNISNGVSSYRLMLSDETFRIRTGRPKNDVLQVNLALSRPLDRETKDHYSFILIAEDGGTPSLTGTLSIRVRVTDTNDNKPRFSKDTYTVFVSENAAVGDKVLRLTATDLDIGPNSELVYGIGNTAITTVNDFFNVDKHTGDILLKQRLDFETLNEHTIPVMVRDNAQDPSLRRTASATVEIRVQDMNDEVPSISIFHEKLTLPTTRFQVTENGPAEQKVAIVEVEDKDAGLNGQIACHLEGNTKFQLSTINVKSTDTTRTFDLKTTRALDREESSVESIRIRCFDHGQPANSNSTNVYIEVLDLNDNSPVFYGGMYEGKFLDVNIAENRHPNTLLTTIKATDADEPNQPAAVEYSLDARGLQDFNIDPRNGKLTTKHSFDREERDRILLTVIGKDRGQPTRSSTIDIRVFITDENDEVPRFINGDVQFDINEGDRPGQIVGILHATDKDSGVNGQIQFHLLEGQVPFKVNPQSGEIVTKIVLDREKQSRYDFNVMARDKGQPQSQSSTVHVTINVKDVNDNSPIFIFPRTNNNTVFTSYQNSPGTPIATILAKDNDIGQNSKLWYFVAGGDNKKLFEMDGDQGQLIIAKKLTKADIGHYRLTIEVRDSGDQPMAKRMDLIVAVNDSPPASPPLSDQFDGKNDKRPASMDRNLILVISLVVAATILAVAFVALIVWLRSSPTTCFSRRTANGNPIGVKTVMLPLSNRNYPYTGTLEGHTILSIKETQNGSSDFIKQKMPRSTFISPSSQRRLMTPVGAAGTLPSHCSGTLPCVADQDSGHGSQENLHTHHQLLQSHSKTLPHVNSRQCADYNYYGLANAMRCSKEVEPSYYTTETSGRSGISGSLPRGHTYQILEHSTIEKGSGLQHTSISECNESAEHSCGLLAEDVTTCTLPGVLSSPVFNHRVLGSDVNNKPRLYSVLTSSFV